VREQLLKLKIFDLLIRLIRVQEDQALRDDALINELTIALPHEKPRQLFRTLLSWGRYAEIITYDQRRHVLRLYEARKNLRMAPVALPPDQSGAAAPPPPPLAPPPEPPAAPGGSPPTPVP